MLHKRLPVASLCVECERHRFGSRLRITQAGPLHAECQPFPFGTQVNAIFNQWCVSSDSFHVFSVYYMVSVQITVFDITGLRLIPFNCRCSQIVIHFLLALEKTIRYITENLAILFTYTLHIRLRISILTICQQLAFIKQSIGIGRKRYVTELFVISHIQLNTASSVLASIQPRHTGSQQTIATFTGR